MIIKFTILCFLLDTFIVDAIEDENARQQWIKYQEQFGKTYKSPLEMEKRFKIFEENFRKIEDNNKDGKSSYVAGMNQFSDWSTEEFLDYIGRGRIVGPNLYGDKFTMKQDFVLPVSVDWREKYAVTSVRDQKMCGGSWAFSAIGALEGQLGLKGNLLSLSEQNLIDCVPNSSCREGSMNAAFDYVRKNGIVTRVSYPFIGQDGSCHQNPSNFVTKTKEFVKIPANDEDGLLGAIATVGPISVAIDATEMLQIYKGGILNDTICSNDSQNHAVVVVGFGSENQTDFYIIKNSWGEHWGEEGYFRLMRNGNETCGIASQASYPVL